MHQKIFLSNLKYFIYWTFLEVNKTSMSLLKAFDGVIECIFYLNPFLRSDCAEEALFWGTPKLSFSEWLRIWNPSSSSFIIYKISGLFTMMSLDFCWLVNWNPLNSSSFSSTIIHHVKNLHEIPRIGDKETFPRLIKLLLL